MEECRTKLKLKEDLVNHNPIHELDTKTIFSQQFEILKSEKSETSKALQKELKKSAEIFKFQWDNLKSYQ